ncbi:MAG: CGNR zinc finger domain-containing protein [Gemmatimonadales bacterium]
MADDQFTLLGDAVWLDFVNTARGRIAPPPDLLPDFAAWRRWTLTRKLDAGEDSAEFPDIRRLRDQLTALAEALHAERPPPGGPIAAINEILAHRSGSQQLTRVSGRWRLRFAPARASSALEVIARSAAGTLADQLMRVRRCGGENCTLFFADDSPAGSRRWCDAEVCGRDAHVERRRGILR